MLALVRALSEILWSPSRLAVLLRRCRCLGHLERSSAGVLKTNPLPASMPDKAASPCEFIEGLAWFPPGFTHAGRLSEGETCVIALKYCGLLRVVFDTPALLGKIPPKVLHNMTLLTIREDVEENEDDSET